MEQIYRNLLPDNPNPVKSLRVKTSGEVAVLQPLEIELLQQLLNQYPRENYYQKRNYLMLTLIHYQALRVGELKQLKVEDIDLKKATIYIPKNHRSNSRSLELTALQVLEIQDYLAQTRPLLLHYSTNQLFITGGSSENLNNSFLKLKTKLKKGLPQLQNLEHWRSSIIVHWLEHQPLLEVQAKLGHRYASSTERYKIHAIKDLQKELNQHHPLQ
jgi:integrase/recombinase XerD